MKIIHKIISVALASSFFFTACAQTATDLTADEFEKGINKDSVQVLDVRTPAEYGSGHLKNALLADWRDETEFDRRIGYIDKAKPVYIYCLAGTRSAAAAAKMRTIGYQHVYELKGGINAWKTGNKNVEGKSTAKQMTVDEFDKQINASKLVLVDFGAEWCPPCVVMAPVIKHLQDNHPNKFSLVKVDGGRDEEILKKYNVTQLPVFIIYKDGKQVWRKDGVAEEKEIAASLK